MIRISGFFLLLLVVVAFFSCKKNTAHLSPKIMQKVLLDVTLAESYSSVVKDSLRRPGLKNIDSLEVYYRRIFAHYNITAQQFSQSLEWYKEHPSELDSIYTGMTSQINAWQSRPAGMRTAR